MNVTGFDPAIQARDVGDWDLMSHDGSLPHLSVAAKLMLGWIDPGLVRPYNFALAGGGVSDTLTLKASSNLGGAVVGTDLAGIEVRRADGWNYYFEYRQGQGSDIADRQLPQSGSVIGTDVVSGIFEPPLARRMIVQVPTDVDGDGPVLREPADYEEDDPSGPAEFSLEVISRSGDTAQVQLNYGAGGKPDPSIRPWPGGNNWQSPDILIMNAKSDADSSWLNVPWAGTHQPGPGDDHQRRGLRRERRAGELLRQELRDLGRTRGADRLGDDRHPGRRLGSGGDHLDAAGIGDDRQCALLHRRADPAVPGCRQPGDRRADRAEQRRAEQLFAVHLLGCLAGRPRHLVGRRAQPLRQGDALLGRAVADLRVLPHLRRDAVAQGSGRHHPHRRGDVRVAAWATPHSPRPPANSASASTRCRTSSRWSGSPRTPTRSRTTPKSSAAPPSRWLRRAARSSTGSRSEGADVYGRVVDKGTGDPVPRGRVLVSARLKDDPDKELYASGDLDAERPVPRAVPPAPPAAQAPARPSHQRAHPPEARKRRRAARSIACATTCQIVDPRILGRGDVAQEHSWILQAEYLGTTGYGDSTSEEFGSTF